MRSSIRLVPAAMIVLSGLVVWCVPATTSTVAIRELTLVEEVRPTIALAAGTRHANHKTHRNEDPGFGPVARGAARPLPRVSL